MATDDKDVSVEELVDSLFELFDTAAAESNGGGNGGRTAPGGDGVITVQEFKVGLNHFKAGLTDEEVAMLLAELDEDQSGTIDKHEFTEMLEKYAEHIF
mmetsp:Transcript_64824/g.146248  ORF Transcript_64824/g.146248 Transcript_64824/m.146248 type:complete len:99 (+) Transcript_64824:262-558(+)